MSVIITNMDLPKSCHECRFFGFEGVLCASSSQYMNAECALLNMAIGADYSRQGSVPYYPYKSAEHCIAKGERWHKCPMRLYEEPSETVAKQKDIL